MVSKVNIEKPFKKSKSCNTPNCKNKHTKRSRFCNTCNNRRFRQKHPMRSSFNTLKSNAKRRKKIFTITFEDFKEFCYKTEYMAGKGRTKDCYSVDCIINELGYAKGNLQRLSVSDNSKKGIKRLVYDWENKYGFVVTDSPITKNDDDYF